MGLSATAIVAGLVIKDQYDQMKALEDELNANPLYKAKQSIVTLSQEGQHQIVKLANDASVVDRIRACVELLIKKS